MKNNSMTGLIVGVLAVAVLCTLLVEAGWLVWIPVLLALGIAGYIAATVLR